MDGNGNLYVSGTSSATWGTPVNPHAGGQDAFVAKLNTSGVLQQNTFLGSGSEDKSVAIGGIVLDGNGDVCIVGRSQATWGTPLNAYAGGWDAFVAKLTSDLSLYQPPDITVEKTTEPTSVPETGGNVVFTIKVTNNSTSDATLDSLSDSIYGDITTSGHDDISSTDCVVPQSLAANGGMYPCSFTAFVAGEPGSETDVVTAVASNAGGSDTATDDATVTIEDVLPDITITKTANPTSVPEPGDDVVFTIAVTNNSLEATTLDSLMDTDFGNLDGKGTCSLTPTVTLAPSDQPDDSYTCSFTETISGNVGEDHQNTTTVVASDNDGNSDIESDSADVTITDVQPIIAVIKTAEPTEVPEASAGGGEVIFTVMVENNSIETDPVTIMSLQDELWFDLNGNEIVDAGEVVTIDITDPTDPNLLSTTCDTVVGLVLQPGESTSCEFGVFINGQPFEDPVNTVTVTAVDDENNEVSESDDAQVDILTVNQRSIDIESLSANLEIGCEVVSGDFSITDQSEDGGTGNLKVQITSFNMVIEHKVKKHDLEGY